jgi:hypothetical protein
MVPLTISLLEASSGGMRRFDAMPIAMACTS